MCYNTVMDTGILTQAGLSEIQAKIYLYLIRHGQRTPSEVANGIDENRTTVYSALEKLEKLGVVSQKDKGKVIAYVPNHPSRLESLAEKRLRSVARQAKNLESNLPSLINYYTEYQSEPGVATFYGQEGVEIIRAKILATNKPYQFIRSPFDELQDPQALENFKKELVKADLTSENITPSEFLEHTSKEAKSWGLNDRTLLPPGEYGSPIEIEIFGDNVAFINHAKNGMSTLIESPEIADAMRQFFYFSKKYIKKATDQSMLNDEVRSRIEKEPSEE